MTLRNKRGRIRCVSETGWWRDCGNWADKEFYRWAHWLNDMAHLPYCNGCIEELGLDNPRDSVQEWLDTALEEQT